MLYELSPDEPSFFTGSKYFMEVKYTTPTPTYMLNRFNILEGSEIVRLNGRQLNRGTDYDIDYEFGILTFRTPEASQADAQIEVDFEFVPLFGQAKESLAGLSGTFNFSPRTWLASSWLFFSRSTPEERPKLGQEPSRILVGNLYGQWISNPRLMTGLVNAIPLVKSDSESELQLQGEVAVSIPNPNTKGQVYVDDMEGVEDSRELSITRGTWSLASEPAGPIDQGLDRSMVRPYRFNWYNPENVVRRKEVFPELRNWSERAGSSSRSWSSVCGRSRTVDSSDRQLARLDRESMRNLSAHDRRGLLGEEVPGGVGQRLRRPYQGQADPGPRRDQRGLLRARTRRTRLVRQGTRIPRHGGRGSRTTAS